MELKNIPALSKEIGDALDITLPVAASYAPFRDSLVHHINHLINHDFEKLVYYLYRIDVDENKMRHLLHAKQGENAAGLIADLIIERQLQKIESRKKFNTQQDSEEEKW